MKAYVLITVRPGSVPEVLGNLHHLKSVSEASMTFGPYDVVAVIQADDVNQLGNIIATGIQPIPGVLDTMTCLVVEP
jgi:DNA-binding Lrp family transcriptional regulator